MERERNDIVCADIGLHADINCDGVVGVRGLRRVRLGRCTGLENILVAEGSATYKSLDGVVLAANEEGEFDTIAIYPVGKKGEYAVPEAIKNIADRAFYDCDALTGIKFVEGFTNIGSESFYDCDAITSVVMPESARNVGDHSFASCDKLVEFVVYSNLTDYADNAFDGCYYINYDAVTIKVEDSSFSLLIIIAAVFNGDKFVRAQSVPAPEVDPPGCSCDRRYPAQSR